MIRNCQTDRHLVGLQDLVGEIERIHRQFLLWRAESKLCVCSPVETRSGTGTGTEPGRCDKLTLDARQLNGQCARALRQIQQARSWRRKPAIAIASPPQPQRGFELLCRTFRDSTTKLFRSARAAPAPAQAFAASPEATSALAEFERILRKWGKRLGDALNLHSDAARQCALAVQHLRTAKASAWVERWQAAAAFALFFRSPFQLASAAPGIFPRCVHVCDRKDGSGFGFGARVEQVWWDMISRRDGDADDSYVWVADEKKRLGVRYPHDTRHLQLMRNQIEAWSAQNLQIAIFPPAAATAADAAADDDGRCWYAFLNGEGDGPTNELARLLSKPSELKAVSKLKDALRNCAKAVMKTLVQADELHLPLKTIKWASARSAGRATSLFYLDGHHLAPASVTPASVAPAFWRTMRTAFGDCAKLWRAVCCTDTQAPDFAMALELIVERYADLGLAPDPDAHVHLFCTLLHLFIEEQESALRHDLHFGQGHIDMYCDPGDVVGSFRVHRLDELLHKMSVAGTPPCAEWPDLFFRGVFDNVSVHGHGPARTWIAALGSFFIRELFPERKYGIGPYEALTRTPGRVAAGSILPGALGVLLHAAAALRVNFEELRNLTRAYWPAMCAADATDAKNDRREAKEFARAPAPTLADVFPLLMLLPDSKRAVLFRDMLREMSTNRSRESYAARAVLHEYRLQANAQAGAGAGADSDTDTAAVLRAIGEQLFHCCPEMCELKTADHGAGVGLGGVSRRDVARMRATLVGERRDREWTGAEVVRWVRIYHSNAERASGSDRDTVTRLLQEAIAALDSDGCVRFATTMAGSVANARPRALGTLAVVESISIKVDWTPIDQLTHPNTTNLFVCFASATLFVGNFQRSGVTQLANMVQAAMLDFSTTSYSAVE